MREEEMERIVHSYSTMLLRFSMHHVKEEAQAQDIVQNVFMKYMEKQPDFIDEEHEKAWLLRVASNMCKDYLGHWWNRKRNHLTVNDTQFIEKAKTTSSVLEEVRKLSFHQRNAVFLFYFEGYSMKEIAQIFHVKEGTVSSWLTRARKQLRKQMEEEVLYDESLPKFEGYSMKEIAQIFHVKEGTVSSWLTRARKQLRKQMEEEVLYDESLPKGSRTDLRK